MHARRRVCTRFFFIVFALEVFEMKSKVSFLSATMMLACSVEIAGPHDYGVEERGRAGAPREDEDRPTLPSPPAADRWKQLLVTDLSVRESDLGSNRVPTSSMSFAAAMRALGGDDPSGAKMALDWLDTWSASTAGDADTEGAPARPSIAREITCRWLQRRATNACDATCSYCRERRVDLAQAPFALLAVVNRPDLATDPCAHGETEGRLIFVATQETPTKRTLPFTVIFEYAQPGTNASVATRWRDLTRFPFGATLTRELSTLVQAFVRGAEGRGPRLLHVRTNEGLSGTKGEWMMRDFAFHDGALHLEAAHGTPALGWQNTAALSDHVRNADATTSLPRRFSTLEAIVPEARFRWLVDAPESRRASFSASTCNGCHGGERPVDPLRFQHVAPSGGYYGSLESPVQVSRYLHNTYDPANDELGRRERRLYELAETRCAPTPEPPPYAAPDLMNRPGH
jgi:hypothetical protein